MAQETTYKAQSGDTLSKIAQKAGTTVSEILKVNPQIKNPDLIYAGQTYNLPATSVYEFLNGSWTKKKDSTTDIKSEDYVGKMIEMPGNTALIDFADDNRSTVYLYDKSKQTYTPFESIEAVANYYGKTIGEVEQRVNIVPSVVKNMDGGLMGTVLDDSYQIRVSGRADKVPESTPDTSALQSIYGKTKQDSSVEETVGNIIGTLFTTAKLKGDISDATFNKTLKDPTQLAKYTNAVLYGGYTLGDIYKDVKAKELAANGYSQYNNFKAFDENVAAETWRNTADGLKAQSDQNLVTPSTLNMDTSLFDLPIFQISGAAFSTLVEPVDMSSPEFQSEAENIQAAYYDIMMQKAQANTEQDKAIADNNWKIYKEQLEKQYGIKLSDNARVAWNQLQESFAGTAQRGLSGTGIANELTDKYLQDVRRSNERLREAKLTDEENKQRDYLLSYGSPEQINQFVASNPEKAKEWGLTPSDEIKDFYSLDNLRTLYPDKSDEDLTMYRNLVLNDQGYYQSGLYQKMYADKYDLQRQKQEYQENKLYSQKLAEETKAYAPYTSGNPLSSYVPENATVDKVVQPTTVTETKLPVYEDTTKSSQQAAANVSSNLNQTPTPQETPKQQTPSYTDYTVQRGDTLSALANKYGTTVSDIVKLNPQITNPNLIYAGKIYKIPK